MKKDTLILLSVLVLACKQTPKVQLEEQKENTIVEQQNNEETIRSDTNLIKVENVDTIKQETIDTLKKDTLKTEKPKEEKKKEEVKAEPVEPDFPDLPETDTYNPKEDPAPNEFVLIDREAKPKNLQQVIDDIKAECKLKGIKGKATVGVLVSTHGNYLKHYFFGVTSKKLEFVVADKIQQLKFKPAMLNGEPVKMWYKMTIDID